MAATSPLREVLNRIIDFAASVARSTRASSSSSKTTSWSCALQKIPIPQKSDHVSLRLGEGITGWVAKHHQPVAIPSKRLQDPRFQFFNELPEDRFESFLSVRF